MPSEDGRPPLEPSFASPAAARHLPPVSLLFDLWQAVRSFLLPVILVTVFSSGRSYELFFAILILPSFAAALVRYFRFSYILGPEELVIRDGILTRQERHIPYSRIQNIDLIRNPLHRLLGVATVKLETGSGGQAEAEINVLTLAAIDELRSHVFDRRPRPGADLAIAATEPLLELGPRDLLMLGILENRGLVVAAALAGLLAQFDLFPKVNDENAVKALLEQTYSQIVDASSGLSLAKIGLLALSLILAVAVISRTLSIAWAFFRLHGFKLELGPHDLRSEHGLLTRYSTSIPRRRIQQISWRSSWLWRLFGRAAIAVESAGRSGENGQNPGSARLELLPIVQADASQKLVETILPELELGQLEWQPLSRRAFGRMLRKRVILWSLLAPALAYFLGWLGLAFFALGAAWSTLTARRFVTRSGWALGDHVFALRRGVFGQATIAIPLEKIQAVAVYESPFDRRAGMAALHVDTAGASQDDQTRVAYLDRQKALDLAAILTAAAAKRSFRW